MKNSSRRPPPLSDLAAPFTNLIVPDLCNVAVLARLLLRSESSVRDLLRQGILPGRKIGRRWLIERQALLRAVASSSASPRQDDPEPQPFRVLDRRGR